MFWEESIYKLLSYNFQGIVQFLDHYKGKILLWENRLVEIPSVS